MSNTPKTALDLHDIQGNIVKPYGRYGFPKARYVFFGVRDGVAGRQFVSKLAPLVTTAAPWRPNNAGPKISPIPEVTTNVAFTYHGLRDLGVPRASLQTFPDEFAMGMRARRDILGDEGPSAPDHWDSIWRQDERVHIMVALCGRDEVCLEQRYQQVLALAKASGGVELLTGHRGPNGAEDLPYQAASAIYEADQPTAKEHFGYTDGIGDPFFKGTGAYDANLIGGGKPTGLPAETAAGWAALETGEFLLGYRDEAHECPEAPAPKLLAFNGTFMAYRKLHENVGSFDAYLEQTGREFPEGKEALAAKFAGRWRNGAPLSRFPTEQEANEFAERWARAKNAINQAKSHIERVAAKQHFAELNQQFAAFDYKNDLSGGRCPLGAHIRRANPRSGLEDGKLLAFEAPGALSNRRRMIRRGLPYGESQSARNDAGDHGIIFMALNASLRRQFEFVQQQWMNYGNDFKLGNERDALTGNHPVSKELASVVIQRDPNDPKPPFFCNQLPRFVETRGGDYFFIPSLTALRMIGEGNIDPT
jgi:Dyp-type peroxidase family